MNDFELLGLILFVIATPAFVAFMTWQWRHRHQRHR